MPPIFEAEISPGMSPREAVALAQIAEAAGFDRLGISCVALWPDSYQLQALIAANTSRIRIGSMVTNPYTRHAAVHAAALATLDEISEGRAFCGMGVGAGLEALGIDYPKPVRTLRETVTAIRRLLAGESVTFEGQIVTLREAQLNRPPTHRVPIAIGTGPGYELRQPLGIAVVRGLLVAQIFTLYTTPAIYLAMDSLRRRGGRAAAT